MRTKALMNTKIKSLALLASFAIVLSSFATGSLQHVRHPAPAHQELTFRYATRRKAFSYGSNLKRRYHRLLSSFAELAQGYKFLLLVIKLKIARQLDRAWKITNPQVYLNHHPIFHTESSDEDASCAFSN